MQALVGPGLERLAQGVAPPATAPEGVDPEDIRRILGKHTEERGRLSAVLEEIQDEYGYLPEEALSRMRSPPTGGPQLRKNTRSTSFLYIRAIRFTTI